MSNDFYRPLRARAIKIANDVDKRKEAIRFYCTQSPNFGKDASWALQVRCPIELSRGCIGKDFVAGRATMNIEDLRALHEAIGGAITKWDEANREMDRIVAKRSPM